MKKIITILTALVMTMIISTTAFAVTETGTSAKNENKAFKEQFADKQADRKAKVEEAKNIYETLKAKQIEIKAEWLMIKETLSSMTREEKKQALEEYKGQMQGLKDQSKAIRSHIKSSNEQKKAEWGKFKTAVQAKDTEAANTALDKIIALRTAINEKLKTLVSVKDSILSVLKGI